MNERCMRHAGTPTLGAPAHPLPARLPQWYLRRKYYNPVGLGHMPPTGELYEQDWSGGWRLHFCAAPPFVPSQLGLPSAAASACGHGQQAAQGRHHQPAAAAARVPEPLPHPPLRACAAGQCNDGLFRLAAEGRLSVLVGQVDRLEAKEAGEQRKARQHASMHCIGAAARRPVWPPLSWEPPGRTQLPPGWTCPSRLAGHNPPAPAPLPRLQW